MPTRYRVLSIQGFLFSKILLKSKKKKLYIYIRMVDTIELFQKSIKNEQFALM